MGSNLNLQGSERRAKALYLFGLLIGPAVFLVEGIFGNRLGFASHLAVPLLVFGIMACLVAPFFIRDSLGGKIMALVFGLLIAATLWAVTYGMCWMRWGLQIHC